MSVITKAAYHRKYRTAIFKGSRMTAVIKPDTEIDVIEAYLDEHGGEVRRLAWWQDAIIQAWESRAASGLERMHIWAEGHDIEVTFDNGPALLELYGRDPEADALEHFFDAHAT